MRDHGDSSVLKSLAIAFGDGLAFGVGVKLSQRTPRQPALAPAPDGAALMNRLDQVEHRVRRIENAPAAFDPRILEAVTAALDSRLNEHMAQVERRLAEMETRILLETRALEQQDRSLAARMEQDLATMRGQVIGLNREFAGEVSRIVADEVATQVQARTAGIEYSLRAQAMDAADDAVRERLAPIRAEAAVQDQEISELRQRVAAGGSAINEFILAMGEMCRQAAERLAPPAAPGSPVFPPATNAAANPPETGAELREHFDQPAESTAPSFAEVRKPGGFWRMPMVSSLVAAVASIAALRFF